MTEATSSGIAHRTTIIERTCEALFAGWPEAFLGEPARIRSIPHSRSTSSSAPSWPTTRTPPAARFCAYELAVSTSPAPPLGSCWRGRGPTTPRGSPSSASPPPPAVAADRCRCANGSQHAPSGRGDARQYLASASQQTYHRSNDVRHTAPGPAVTPAFCTSAPRGRAAWSGCTSGPPRALTPRPTRWGGTMNAHTTRKMISAEA